jgi:hypothetical protein
VTHDNGKDHFPACSGEYLRGGRAGDARMGPAGALRRARAGQPAEGRGPAGTIPATGRPRHRAASRGISQRGLGEVLSLSAQGEGVSSLGFRPETEDAPAGSVETLIRSRRLGLGRAVGPTGRK